MEDIKWFGHASFQFTDKNGNKIYYVDPFDLKGEKFEPADLIFITHAHQDHLSINDIAKLIKPDVTIVAPKSCIDLLTFNNEKIAVFPNSNYNIKGFEFKTVPAYNISKPFHPKENNWVGYIFNLNGKKIYHAGDTDFIPEMNELKSLNLDIAMLPMGGTYAMDVDEAIKAANTISAKITIPMHYKRLLGGSYKEAEEKLKAGVTNSKVVILEEIT